MCLYSLYPFIRPLLFSLPPELSHKLVFETLNTFKNFIPIHEYSKPLKVMGLDFQNPIGLAAGLDKNGEYLDLLSKFGFGFLEVGTVTPKAQIGNSKPRLFRLKKDEALINRLGFNNQGIDTLLINIQKSHYLNNKLKPLGINIGKNANTPIDNALSDYLIGLEKSYPYASYITINLSSPNTQDLRELQKEKYLADFLKALKQKQSYLNYLYQRYVPLVLKVAPDLSLLDIKKISGCLLEYSIDGLIATNTLVEKPKTLKSKNQEQKGGISGAPIFEKSLEVVSYFSEELKNTIPIIAVGGINSPERAQQMLKAGARLIQIYTGLIYQGPDLIREIFQKVF